MGKNASRRPLLRFQLPLIEQNFYFVQLNLYPQIPPPPNSKNDYTTACPASPVPRIAGTFPALCGFFKFCKNLQRICLLNFESALFEEYQSFVTDGYFPMYGVQEPPKINLHFDLFSPKFPLIRIRPCLKKVKTPKRWIFIRHSALNVLAGRQPACKNLP